VKDWILADTTNHVYWQKTRHHGYGYDNKEIFEEFFTDKVEEAALLTWEEAVQVVYRIFDNHYVLGGYVKNVNPLCFEILNRHEDT